MNPRDTQAEDLATKRPARGLLRTVGAAWERQVGEQVDCDLAWLVVLRIAAGLAGMVVPALYWLLPQRFDGFLQSQVQIPYAALPWIAPLPSFVMKALLGIAVLAGVCVLLGLYFRVAALTLFVVFAYHFLLDSSYYQSTAYLLVLLSLLLACSPAHHLWALDARRIAAEKRGRGGVLLLWIFRFQLALVYFYAGVAKIDADWVSGRTLSVMVPAARLDALSSRFLSSQGVSVAMSWIGLAFDLLVAPGLLWRRTRTFALVALVLFHLHNALTFRLVHLPWAMLFLSTVFLEPSWPRKLLRFVPIRQTPPASSLPPLRPSRWALLAALVYCTCQTAVPLRKWLYAGNAYFTECGFPFSWAMRSRVKNATTELLVIDKQTGQRELIPLGKGMQPMQAGRAQGDPHAIWLLSQRLSQRARKEGRSIAVYARSVVSLNGSVPTVFVACDVDLTQQTFPLFGVPSWVTLGPNSKQTPLSIDELRCVPSLGQPPPS